MDYVCAMAYGDLIQAWITQIAPWRIEAKVIYDVFCHETGALYLSEPKYFLELLAQEGSESLNNFPDLHWLSLLKRISMVPL